MSEGLPQCFERERGLDGSLRVLPVDGSQRFEREHVSARPNLLRHLNGNRRRQRQHNPEPSARPWVPEIAKRVDQMHLALRDFSRLQQGFAEQMAQAAQVAAGSLGARRRSGKA